MATSFFLKRVRTYCGTGLQAAIALNMGGWLLGCSDANSITTPPPARVLTSVTVSVDGEATVGHQLFFEINAFDQFGRPMVPQLVTKGLSDSTHAIIIRDSDFGDYLLGAVPGTTVLTATATVGTDARSATRTITIDPSDSGVVNAIGQLGGNWHFKPATVSVTRTAGDAQIAWNLYNGSHTVHWDSQPSGATVADIDSVTAAEVTRHFTVAGTYEYHCLIHSDMIGTIVVE